MFNWKKKEQYLDDHNIYDIIIEFNADLNKETGFGNWMHNEVNCKWEFVQLIVYDNRPFGTSEIFKIQPISEFAWGLDKSMHKILKEHKEYLIDDSTKKPITTLAFKNWLNSFKPNLISLINKKNEELKQQYASHNYRIVQYDRNAKMCIVAYDDRFYEISAYSIMSLQWDKVKRSFAIDEKLAFIKDDKDCKFEVFWRGIDDENMEISFRLPLPPDLLDISKKIRELANNFTQSFIHKDNWLLIQNMVCRTYPDGDTVNVLFSSTLFNRNMKQINNNENEISLLDIKDGNLVFNNNYKHLMNWFNMLIERDKAKPLSRNDLLNILETSYKETAMNSNNNALKR